MLLLTSFMHSVKGNVFRLGLHIMLVWKGLVCAIWHLQQRPDN